MFCQHCGKPIPDGANHCSFCGARVDEPAPRHARPEDDELYSYSDRRVPDDDVTRVYEPDQIDQTKVYNFAAFEGQGNGYDPNRDPNYDPGRDPNYDPNDDPRYPDGPVPIGDDYENYQDGQSDDTFMDRVDQRFRRDEYDEDYDDPRRPRRKKSKAWIWIIVVILVIAAVVIAFFALKGKLFGKNDTKPTAPTTVAATAQPTQAPATQAPAPTEAHEEEREPETFAPTPTEAPVIVTEAPRPETQAPTPTQAPVPTTPASNGGQEQVAE